MYQTNRRELVREAGAWLGETSWDFFSTFTYRYDIKQKQNYKIMEGLRSSLQKLGLPHYIFYVTEFTSSSSTHNHMLIKGDGVKEAVESHLRAKNLLYNNVVHYPYKSSLGANYYVSKFIGDDRIWWDVIL